MKIKRFEHIQGWRETRKLTSKRTAAPDHGNTATLQYGSTAALQHGSTATRGGENA